MLLEHLKANFAAGASAKQHKLPFLCDKDARMPIDVAGLQYAQKWIEEDDDLRGDSLLEDAQSRSSVTEFAQVIGMLAMPAWVEVMQPSKSYWNRALFWCATTGDKVGVDAALKSGADAKWRHPLVNRRTALHMAAQYANSADIMRTLIDAMQSVKGGVDVSKILDGDNNNPVHLFVLGTTNHSNNGETGAYPEMLTMLLDAGTPEQRRRTASVIGGFVTGVEGSPSDEDLATERETSRRKRVIKLGPNATGTVFEDAHLAEVDRKDFLL